MKAKFAFNKMVSLIMQCLLITFALMVAIPVGISMWGNFSGISAKSTMIQLMLSSISAPFILVAWSAVLAWFMYPAGPTSYLFALFVASPDGIATWGVFSPNAKSANLEMGLSSGLSPLLLILWTAFLAWLLYPWDTEVPYTTRLAADIAFWFRGCLARSLLTYSWSCRVRRNCGFKLGANLFPAFYFLFSCICTKNKVQNAISISQWSLIQLEA